MTALAHKTVKAAATATDKGYFSALAATYTDDRVGDRIIPGAFAKTIAAWQNSQKRVPLHWDHVAAADHIIGWVEPGSMRETEDGLYVEGQLDLKGSGVARDAWRSMKNNAVSLSFGYLTKEQRKSKDGINELLEIDLFEVSIVPAPASADTRILSVKAVKDMAGIAELKNVREAQVKAVKDALSNKAIVRDPSVCSIEEPWAVMDGDEAVSCHANQEDAREGMEKRMSSIAEAAARAVEPEPEPADERTLRRAMFDEAMESATEGLPKKAESKAVDTEETIRTVVKEELARVAQETQEREEKAKPPTQVVRHIESEPQVSEVEDGSDEELKVVDELHAHAVKSAPQDPLRKRTGDVLLEIASDGLPRRKYQEPTPEPEPEPLDERELRRQWNAARLEIASG